LNLIGSFTMFEFLFYENSLLSVSKRNP